MHKCCSNCFTDKTLKLKINQNGQISRCHYCGNSDSSAIYINDLYNFIVPLLEAISNSYIEYSNGVNIIEILLEDFVFFNNNTQAHTLINDALQDKPILLNKRFLKFSQDTVNEWHRFKHELIHNNRFFPQTKIYKNAFLESGNLFSIFTEVIEQLNYQINTSDTFFRARISDENLTHEKMGKPPKDKVSIGRANPDGISYLYIAENIETALTEVRPSNGQTVSIAQFKSISDINVINLRNPRRDISFLSLSLNDNFHNILKLVCLLEEFSKELSLPVLPTRSRLDYIPTQFITEFFKNLGKINGLMFTSSFGKGFNIVIFNDDLMNCVEAVAVQNYRVNSIELSHDIL
ncbi:MULTISPECIES: RES domain-containing protein [Acinetobacter]|uniref:RES domain-containing protein n=1 Tax=Acinetobacter TaxID=469 RepID=UPI0002AE7E04|nr:MULTISPECIES: RES domain-containing protein [Acinetobacter]ELW89638.1 RES domain protein [Acinetobacter sp. WC-743]